MRGQQALVLLPMQWPLELHVDSAGRLELNQLKRLGKPVRLPNLDEDEGSWEKPLEKRNRSSSTSVR